MIEYFLLFRETKLTNLIRHRDDGVWIWHPVLKQWRWCTDQQPPKKKKYIEGSTLVQITPDEALLEMFGDPTSS